MPERFWVIIVAIGLVLSGELGHAQDQVPQTGSRAGGQPSVHYQLPFSVPVIITEDKTAADARQSNEAEARKRERDDLIAQQGMNAATQEINIATQAMAEYAFLSMVFVGVGTVLLFVTLYLTREANRAAQESVKVARRIGEAQTRAYLSISVRSLNMHRGTAPPWRPGFTIDLRNSGMSPADEVELICHWKLVVGEAVEAEGISHHPTYSGLITVAGNGAGDTIDAWLSEPRVPEEIIPLFHSGNAHWDVTITAKFQTIYGRGEVSARFCSHLIHSIDEDGVMSTENGFKKTMRRVHIG